jgi:putative two-component system response regulator
MNKTQTILVVDDIKENIDVLNAILKEDYHIKFALSGKMAIALAKKFKPDIILLDVMMPEMDGFETCQILKQDMMTKNIPIIFVTGNSATVDEVHGFELGAVDYITKPVTPAIVKSRINTHLRLADHERQLYKEVKAKTKELFDTQIEIINVLGRASEFKDSDTGMHIKRVSAYAHLIALKYGLDERDAELLALATPMHDVGKIGVEDDILKKRGKLTDEERSKMCEHALIGGQILGNHHSKILQYAKLIAEQHHEKWDGTGYPLGLSGEEIHIFSRIVAVADVFDALTSKRSYKEAWPVEKAMDLIKGQVGKHFDPEVASLFVLSLDEVVAIKNTYKDDDLAGKKSSESLVLNKEG